MADAEPEKSRGLKFAERQLLRHGWEQGKGLGRNESGISEAIKVKVKCGKGGVGHKEGDQFTFHWWDHVFNKSSSSLQVESDHNGINVRKNSHGEAAISNKRPRKASLAKEKLYGAFVKSATLLSGREQSVASVSSDSSSSDEDEKLDLSTTTKISDARLVKACGGRTAHKGARHGLNMSAKLARLEQQEAEFMAKYGKNTQVGTQVDSGLGTSKNKKKNKRKSEDRGIKTTSEDVLENGQSEIKIKRKKSTHVPQDGDNETILVHTEDPLSPKKKNKKKKKKKKKSKE